MLHFLSGTPSVTTIHVVLGACSVCKTLVVLENTVFWTLLPLVASASAAAFNIAAALVASASVTRLKCAARAPRTEAPCEKKVACSHSAKKKKKKKLQQQKIVAGRC